jgi:cyanophycin synthetase
VDCELALGRAGFRLGSRPPAGARVPVTGISNAGGEAESESVLPRVGKDLRAEAGCAAEALGIRLAGVDVITRDPGVSLHASGGRVTEVNTTPGLHWHYLIRNPEAGVRVAVPILARLLA